MPLLACDTPLQVGGVIQVFRQHCRIVVALEQHRFTTEQVLFNLRRELSQVGADRDFLPRVLHDIPHAFRCIMRRVERRHLEISALVRLVQNVINADFLRDSFANIPTERLNCSRA